MNTKKQPPLAAANLAFTPVTHKAPKQSDSPFLPLKIDDLETPLKNKSQQSFEQNESPHPQPIFRGTDFDSIQEATLSDLKLLLLNAVKLIDVLQNQSNKKKAYKSASTQTSSSTSSNNASDIKDIKNNNNNNIKDNDFKKNMVKDNNKIKNNTKNTNKNVIVSNNNNNNNFPSKNINNKPPIPPKQTKKFSINNKNIAENTEVTINDESLDLGTLKKPSKQNQNADMKDAQRNYNNISLDNSTSPIQKKLPKNKVNKMPPTSPAAQEAKQKKPIAINGSRSSLIFSSSSSDIEQERISTNSTSHSGQYNKLSSQSKYDKEDDLNEKMRAMSLLLRNLENQLDNII